MKLTSLNLTAQIIESLQMSVGYSETQKLIDINTGILDTKILTLSDVKHVAEIESYQLDTLLNENTPYVVDGSIYMCLSAPDHISLIKPTQKLFSNIILDDLYVWRYICDVDEQFGNYSTIKLPELEIIKRGSIRKANILQNSNHSLSSYPVPVIHENNLSGFDAEFVIDTDPDTNIITSVLVQNGGEDYDDTDLLVITNNQHTGTHAEINLSINNGQVDINSFTNGTGYSYLDIIVIGDGTGCELGFNTAAGILTDVNIVSAGQGYTWAKAIIVNSSKYIICNIVTEPLNSYNSDLHLNLKVNKYLIQKSFETSGLINFYGVHTKKEPNKLIDFDAYFVQEFELSENEKMNIQIVLG